MHYFSNKFSKIAKRSADYFSDLKLRDLTKLCFSNWLWQNWTLQISCDVILVTSSLLRHRKMSPN